MVWADIWITEKRGGTENGGFETLKKAEWIWKQLEKAKQKQWTVDGKRVIVKAEGINNGLNWLNGWKRIHWLLWRLRILFEPQIKADEKRMTRIIWYLPYPHSTKCDQEEGHQQPAEESFEGSEEAKGQRRIPESEPENWIFPAIHLDNLLIYPIWQQDFLFCWVPISVTYSGKSVGWEVEGVLNRWQNVSRRSLTGVSLLIAPFRV